MLVDLHIRDYALIHRLDLEFGPGLNILTGETGAGKSIVVGAVKIILGERALSEDIRSGAEGASVEAAFSLPAGSDAQHLLAELEIEEADGTALIRRDISRSGRNRCRINGRLVTVSQTADMARELVDIHGQHDHQSLLHADRQLDLLDAYAGHEAILLRQEVGRLYRMVDQVRTELAALDDGEREQARRLDLLTFQRDEIDAAALQPEEDDILERERRVLANAERLLEQTAGAYSLLTGEAGGGGVSTPLGEAQAALEEAAGLDEGLTSVRTALQEAMVLVQEAASDLRRYGEQAEADPARLEQIEERLALIHSLKRKYGASLDEIMAFREQVAADLEAISTSAERREASAQTLEDSTAALAGAAGRLSSLRREAAAGLAEDIKHELAELNLDQAEFQVFLRQVEADDGIDLDGCRVAAGPTGVDRAEFRFSANPGEAPKSLARIASGGELSRVMLAVKTVLAEVDSTPVLIFDEVDAGVGGRTAQAVAQRLADLARNRQVLCVTHLPQIACMADRHYVIEKHVADGRTQVAVYLVEKDEQVTEMARMLGGTDTPATLEHARELLRLAQKAKTAS